MPIVFPVPTVFPMCHGRWHPVEHRGHVQPKELQYVPTEQDDSRLHQGPRTHQFRLCGGLEPAQDYERCQAGTFPEQVPRDGIVRLYDGGGVLGGKIIFYNRGKWCSSEHHFHCVPGFHRVSGVPWERGPGDTSWVCSTKKRSYIMKRVFTKVWAGRCHPLGWHRNAHEKHLHFEII